MSEPSWELLGGGGVLGPAGIDYIGAWDPAVAYQPGQIVRYNGVDYLACNPSTGQTPPPAVSGMPPVVNGQWLKGVGGAAVWASILAKDVIAIGATTSSSLSAANIDIAWPLGQGAHTLFHEVNATGNAGSIRSYGYPLGQGGTRLVLRHNGSGSSSFAVLHNASVTSPRTPLYLATGRDRTLLPGEAIEFVLDDSYGLWMEVGRDVVVPYGTSLPTAPGDGTEAVLVDNVANPTYSWRFRYNAQSSSAYKWEFIGGPDAYSFIVTQEAPVAVNAWTSLPTLGPDFVLPRSGDYFVSWGSQVNPGANVGYSGVADASVSNNPLTPGLSANVAAGMGIGQFTKAKLLGLGQAHTLRFVVYQTAAGILYTNRLLIVSPVRVA